MKRYEIYVTNKEGIFDPAGETSKKALLNLGYTGVLNVSIGKYVQIDVDDEVGIEAIEEMCQKLLANPVIEDYKIKD